MASLDHLPADQRAVLELVLQRGRNYDQIATLLSVDRAGVRQRALSAFDALAPDTTKMTPIISQNQFMGKLKYLWANSPASTITPTPFCGIRSSKAT